MLGIIVDIYFTVVLAEVAVHWLIHFKILDVKSVYVSSKAVEILNQRLPSRFIRKFRKKFPPFPEWTSSPFILLMALLFLSRFIYRLDVMLM